MHFLVVVDHNFYLMYLSGMTTKRCSINHSTKRCSINHSTLSLCHMRIMRSQISCNLIVCSTTCSGFQKRKHQSSALLDICGVNPLVTHRFPSQRASNEESCSLSRLHHGNIQECSCTIDTLYHISQHFHMSLSILSLLGVITLTCNMM